MKLFAIALLALPCIASTPGACTLPNPDQQTGIRVNDPCRGPLITVTPGAIWMVALNADPTQSSFTTLRFIVQFGPAESGGVVRAYYTYLGSNTPYQGALINGRRYGRSLTEMHMGLLRIGAALDLQSINVQTGAAYTGNDRHVGWAMKF